MNREVLELTAPGRPLQMAPAGRNVRPKLGSGAAASQRHGPQRPVVPVELYSGAEEATDSDSGQWDSELSAAIARQKFGLAWLARLLGYGSRVRSCIATASALKPMSVGWTDGYCRLALLSLNHEVAGRVLLPPCTDGSAHHCFRSTASPSSSPGSSCIKLPIPNSSPLSRAVRVSSL